MDQAQDERRGNQARNILNDELYRESHVKLRDKIVMRLEMADTSESERQRLCDLLVAHRKIKQYMEQILFTGEMAERELEQKRTMAERAKEVANDFYNRTRIKFQGY